MTRSSSFFLFVLVLVGVLTAYASAETDKYRMATGDVLEIEVKARDGMTEDDISGTFTISPAGDISYSWVGELRVEDMTLNEIDNMLSSILENDYLIDPSVRVIIAEYHKKKVYVTGQIGIPGEYQFSLNESIRDILFKAGGPTKHAGEEISLIRTVMDENTQEHSTEIILNLQKVIEGDPHENLPLENEDLIVILPKEKDDHLWALKKDADSEEKVVVLGQVNKPGAYRFRKGMTVLDIILEAGGLKEYAASNKTRLVRFTGKDNKKKETIRVFLGDILKGERQKDIELMPGDMLIVPESFF